MYISEGLPREPLSYYLNSVSRLYLSKLRQKTVPRETWQMLEMFLHF